MPTTTNPSTGTETGGKNKAQDVASTVTDKAKQAASALSQKAEDATHAVGSGLRSMAGTLRDKGPSEGVMGGASSSIASGLESSARYLQDEGLKGIAEDVTSLIRRNPMPAMLVGVGLGYFLARATSRS